MKKVLANDLLEFKFAENPKYNPSGTILAYQVAFPCEKDNCYRRDIWAYRNGLNVQLTNHFNASMEGWLDDEHLLFRQNTPEAEPGFTEIKVLDVNTNEIKSFLKLNFAAFGLKKIDANTYVCLGGIDANDPDAYLDSEEVRKEKAGKIEKNRDYEILDEIPYWGNGKGFTNKKRSALFEIELEPFKVTRLTDANFSVHEFEVDGDKVYFTGSEAKVHRSWFSKLYCLDLDNREMQTLYDKEDLQIESLFVIDHIVHLTCGIRNEAAKKTAYKAFKIVQGEWKEYPYIDRSLYNAVATDIELGGGQGSKVVSDAYYTIATDVDHTCIWKISTEFEKEEILMRPLIPFMDVTEEKIAFGCAYEDSLIELYEMKKDGGEIRKITSLNDAYIAEHYVAFPHEIKYVSEGEELNGWVLLPEDFDENRKYPAVLDVHGGPRGIYSTSFFHEMQLWASKGYVVFFTNIHGSDGRGNDFADIYGKYGTIDYQNLMDFTDTVLSAYPAIDEKRVCVTGGSYGGFMTNWIIGHTHRFVAAASQRSISNWLSFGFISDIGPGFDHSQHLVDDIIEDAEKLWEFSPLKYAKNATTPTLFIHSDEDYRCPLPEGMQLMQALAYYGVETKMVLFHGENHELSRGGKPLHRIKRLEEITGWFEKYAK